MIAKPKRRWYQFSLRTLFLVMTLAGVGAAWWVHAQFCLRHVADCRMMANRPYFRTFFSGRPSSWEQYAREEEIKEKRAQKLSEHYDELATAYRRAVWFPWERLWIDETLPLGASP